MRILDLFQKYREYSQFQWVNRLSTMVNEYPKCYLLVPWALFFLFDVFVSYFYPDSYPLSVSLINFLFSTPFPFFLFLYYFPGCKHKAEMGFLTLKLIELVVFLTITKFMVFGYRDFSYIHGSNFILINEFLMFLEFGFFALLWWSLREFLLALQKNFDIQLNLLKAQADLDNVRLSPHFLFNALNNIAGRSALFSKDLFFEVSALSQLLQQAYKDPNLPHFLPDEIQILNNMLNLMRNNSEKGNVQLLIEYDRPLEHFKIPKLILGTLLENMFKYGVLNESDNAAEMKIIIRTTGEGNSQLICSTINLIHPIKKSFSSGRGLVSINNIIKQQFGEEFTFDWFQNKNEFKILMILNYGQIEIGTY